MGGFNVPNAIYGSTAFVRASMKKIRMPYYGRYGAKRENYT